MRHPRAGSNILTISSNQAFQHKLLLITGRVTMPYKFSGHIYSEVLNHFYDPHRFVYVTLLELQPKGSF